MSQCSSCSAFSPGADLGHLCHILVVTGHEFNLRWCQEKPACGYITQPPSLITPPQSHITTPLSHITPPLSHQPQPHLISHHITFVSHHTHPSHVTPPPSHISCHTTVSHLRSHHHHLASCHTTSISHLVTPPPSHIYPVLPLNCASAVEKKRFVISKLFSRGCGYMNGGTVTVGDVYLFTKAPRERTIRVKLK